MWNVKKPKHNNLLCNKIKWVVIRNYNIKERNLLQYHSLELYKLDHVNNKYNT